MPDSMTVSLPSTMPLMEQVTEVNKKISEWINSLEEPFNDELDVFQLMRYERNGNKNCYHYIISRDAKSPKRKR
ncbi:hypothetical protein ACFL2O_01350 [Thermodesulfobacteriota bacterium]